MQKSGRAKNAFINDITEFSGMIERSNVEAMREKMRISTEKRCLFDKPDSNKVIKKRAPT